MSHLLHSLDTRDIPPGQQFDSWQHAANETFYELDISIPRHHCADSGNAFPAHFNAWQLNVVGVSEIMQGSMVEVRRTRKLAARASRRFFNLKLQLEGSGYFSQFDRDAILAPGDFVLCDNTEPYNLYFEGCSRQVVITIPEEFMNARFNEPGRLAGIHMPYVQGSNRMLLEFATSLLHNLPELAPASIPQMERALLELICAIYTSAPAVRAMDISTTRLGAGGNRRPSKEQLERLVAGLSDSLTDREIQVCARAILGMTGEGIGLELGIKLPTVATLKKRAYAKLNISSSNELFALCLSRLSTTGV